MSPTALLHLSPETMRRHAPEMREPVHTASRPGGRPALAWTSAFLLVTVLALTTQAISF